MTLDRNTALKRFREARKQAERDQLASLITGRDNQIIPFEVIRRELRQQNPLYRGIQNVALKAIVGSVGRSQEFTRRFLPLSDSLAERWVGVDALAQGRGWPPIELYQVDQTYFVKDGNHRVSVAQQLQTGTIEAHVWEYPIETEVTPEDDLSAILIRLGKANFMEKTGLDESHPHHQIHFTSPGQYGELLAQIVDLRQTLAVIDGEEMPYREAVAAWYEMVYLPTVLVIRDSTLLEDFPGRTEADLFVWMSKYREPLREQYGDYDNLDELAELLATNYKEGALQKAARQVRRLLGQEALPPLVEIEPDVD
ncbi:MAG: hypothetical protein H6658_01640 [Ardenticatenaceae bacterium]|nr:hypothetical protein [Ardenticatenaceae bacterium]